MTERRRTQEEIHLFIIRLWPESFNGGRRVWRGQVVHAGKEGKRYFARWIDLLRFVCKRVGIDWEGHVDVEIMTEVSDGKSD